MKYLVSIFIFVLSFYSATSQTSTNVITHKKIIINTDPSKGAKSFIKEALFPDKNKSIRRITMYVTLAYPEDRAIAHWDYTDRIYILHNDKENTKFEIGRLLTPYGSNFKEGWSYTWKVDVTDFEPFLHDNVEIEYVHTGYESPDLGWDLTIDFKIDFGPPIANFISVDKMWEGNFQYGNPENDIENSLVPIKIKTKKGASFGRFRIQHTGHGMDKENGCSEFCNRWRELVFDGKVIDHRDMWKDCGDNPLYPQGGTWIFDRAYWCPGDLQAPDIFDIPLSNTSHVLDLNMKPFIANDVKQPREQITSYFFQFAEPNHANDVAIEDIIAPNNISNFNRFNPTGFNSGIKIRNLGKESLKSLKITYKTIGFKMAIYEWKGNLAFYETVTIKLPGEIYANVGTNTFSVVLSAPNGVKDEWPLDNKMESKFDDIPTLPSKIVVDFLTNNHPEENSFFIVNSKQDTVYMKSPEMLKALTKYSDTLQLAEGNYSLMLTDSGGDGLEFWFQPEAGYGSLRLKDAYGNLIQLFESDNGNGQFYGFRIKKYAKIDPSIVHLSVNIFPRMVTDYLTIYTVTNKMSTLKIRITKDGKYMEQHEFTNVKESDIGLDVRHLEKGRYVMEIYMNGDHKMNRRFNKR